MRKREPHKALRCSSQRCVLAQHSAVLICAALHPVSPERIANAWHGKQRRRPHPALHAATRMRPPDQTYTELATRTNFYVPCERAASSIFDYACHQVNATHTLLKFPCVEVRLKLSADVGRAGLYAQEVSIQISNTCATQSTAGQLLHPAACTLAIERGPSRSSACLHPKVHRLIPFVAAGAHAAAPRRP